MSYLKESFLGVTVNDIEALVYDKFVFTFCLLFFIFAFCCDVFECEEAKALLKKKKPKNIGVNGFGLIYTTPRSKNLRFLESIIRRKRYDKIPYLHGHSRIKLNGEFFDLKFAIRCSSECAQTALYNFYKVATPRDLRILRKQIFEVDELTVNVLDLYIKLLSEDRKASVLYGDGIGVVLEECVKSALAIWVGSSAGFLFGLCEFIYKVQFEEIAWQSRFPALILHSCLPQFSFSYRVIIHFVFNQFCEPAALLQSDFLVEREADGALFSNFLGMATFYLFCAFIGSLIHNTVGYFFVYLHAAVVYALIVPMVEEYTKVYLDFMGLPGLFFGVVEFFVYIKQGIPIVWRIPALLMHMLTDYLDLHVNINLHSNFNLIAVTGAFAGFTKTTLYVLYVYVLIGWTKVTPKLAFYVISKKKNNFVRFVKYVYYKCDMIEKRERNSIAFFVIVEEILAFFFGDIVFIPEVFVKMFFYENDFPILEYFVWITTRSVLAAAFGFWSVPIFHFFHNIYFYKSYESYRMWSWYHMFAKTSSIVELRQSLPFRGAVEIATLCNFITNRDILGFALHLGNPVHDEFYKSMYQIVGKPSKSLAEIQMTNGVLTSALWEHLKSALYSIYICVVKAEIPFVQKILKSMPWIKLSGSFTYLAKSCMDFVEEIHHMVLERMSGKSWLESLRPSKGILLKKAYVELYNASQVDMEADKMIYFIQRCDEIINRLTSYSSELSKDETKMMNFCLEFRYKLVKRYNMTKRREFPFPVFIVGGPNTGKTTLTQQIVNFLLNIRNVKRTNGDVLSIKLEDKFPAETVNCEHLKAVICNEVPQDFSQFETNDKCSFTMFFQSLLDNDPLTFRSAEIAKKNRIHTDVLVAVMTSNFNRFLDSQPVEKLVRRFNAGLVVEQIVLNSKGKDAEPAEIERMTLAQRNLSVRYRILEVSAAGKNLKFDKSSNADVVMDQPDFFRLLKRKYQEHVQNEIKKSKMVSDTCSCGLMMPLHIVSKGEAFGYRALDGSCKFPKQYFDADCAILCSNNRTREHHIQGENTVLCAEGCYIAAAALEAVPEEVEDNLSRLYGDIDFSRDEPSDGIVLTQGEEEDVPVPEEEVKLDPQEILDNFNRILQSTNKMLIDKGYPEVLKSLVLLLTNEFTWLLLFILTCLIVIGYFYFRLFEYSWFYTLLVSYSISVIFSTRIVCLMYFGSYDAIVEFFLMKGLVPEKWFRSISRLYVVVEMSKAKLKLSKFCENWHHYISMAGMLLLGGYAMYNSRRPQNEAKPTKNKSVELTYGNVPLPENTDTEDMVILPNYSTQVYPQNPVKRNEWKRSTDVNQMKVEVQQMSMLSLKRLIDSQTFEFHYDGIKDGKKCRMRSHMIMVNQWLMLLNRHVFLHGDRIVFEVKPMNIILGVSLKDCFSYSHYDFLFCVSNMPGMFTDLSRYMCDEPYLISSRCSPVYEENEYISQPRFVGDVEHEGVMLKYQYCAISIRKVGRPGDCGRGLVTNTKKGWIFSGIQMAAINDESYFQPITSDAVKRAMSKLLPDFPTCIWLNTIDYARQKIVSRTLVDNAALSEISSPFIQVLGTEGPNKRQFTSNFEKSGLSQLERNLSEPYGIPKHTKASVGGEWYSSFSNTFKNFNMQGDLSYSESIDAIKEYISDLDLKPVQLSPLSLDEAFFGCPKMNVERIDFRTSLGESMFLSYNKAKSNIPVAMFLRDQGYKNKYDLFVEDAETGRFQFDQNVRSDIEKMSLQLDKGLVPILVDMVHKDEIRKESKLSKAKIRLFSVLDFRFNIIARMYLMPLIAWVYQNRSEYPFSAGMNCMSADWKLMYEHLVAEFETAYDADGACFDTAQEKREFMTQAFFWCFIAAMAGYSKDAIRMVRNICLSVSIQVVCFQCDWFLKFKGLTSGLIATLHFNDVTNCRNQYAHFAYRKKFKQFSYALKEVIRFKVMGDDFIGTISDLLLQADPEFLSSIVKFFMVRYGLEVTNANKNGGVEAMKITDAVFLKRKFAYHQDIKDIVGPLDKDSLFKSLVFQNKKAQPNIYERMRQTFDGAQREAMLHGREFFEFFVDQVRTENEQLNMPYPLIYLDYDDLVRKYIERDPEMFTSGL
jgi:hypothetical protein